VSSGDELKPAQESPYSFGLLTQFSVRLTSQGVPTLLHMLRKKRKARFVFSVSLFYTFSMYVILCLSTSIFFGPSISPIVTLNWERYSGGAKHGTAIPWWASGLSYMVLLFPVVSVSAAFPLQLVVISGEIMQAFPCRLMLHLHGD